MNFEDWVVYTDGQKLDVLRQEVQSLSNTVKIGVAIAAALGAAFGSISTLFIQSVIGRLHV